MEKRKKFEFLREKNFNKLKQKVNELNKRNKKIVFVSSDDEINRKALEKLDLDFLMIPLKNRKDFMKQRDSGFNEVLANICKKKNIGIGIDFEEIVKNKAKEFIFSRLRQNIFLCNKNKIQMRFFNYGERDSKGLKSIGFVLGMPSWMVKNLV